MRRIDGSAQFPNDLPAPAVALGNFDGVHLGHRHIIGRTVALARATGGTGAVYTFDPHPVRVLAPAECPAQIQTTAQKLGAIAAAGVDCCVVEPFTAAFAAQTAEAFFEQIVAGRLRAAAVVVGYDFTFGLHRAGTTERLVEFGRRHGIRVEICEAQFLDERLISSTNIRRLVEHGEVAEAARLLGRPHRIEGTVVAGRGIGRELDARTANVAPANELVPADGVYLALAAVGGEATCPAIVSIGDNPTFPHAPFAIEAHLIDAEVDALGKPIAVDFLERMRGQVAFSSVGELREQIQKDIAEARRRHGGLHR